MSTSLAIKPTEVKPLRLLDVYASNGLADESELPRIDALATISAGEKVEKNGREIPRASRDGKISLHDPDGMAPGLRAALELGDHKSLTIAFAYDDPNDFIQQRFVEYSATKLLCYGDERCITLVDDKGHHDFKAGTTRYTELLQRPGMKVQTSVYFHLAEWTPQGPQVVFPDGLGLYRLRFTSRNSSRSLKSSLEYIMRFTSGRIAGLPLELSIGYREVSGPDGAKRKIAVWQCRMRPPEGQRLTSNSFRSYVQDSLEQGAQLTLPPIQRETLALAAAEAPILDMDEAEAEIMEQGGLCDAKHWRTVYFAAFGDAELSSTEGRALFLRNYTGGETDSLSKFLAGATEDDARTMIEAGRAEVARLEARLARREALPEAKSDYDKDLELYKYSVEIANDFGVLWEGTRDWPTLNRPRPNVLANALASVQRALADAGIESKTERDEPRTSLLERSKRGRPTAPKTSEEPVAIEPAPDDIVVENQARTSPTEHLDYIMQAAMEVAKIDASSPDGAARLIEIVNTTMKSTGRESISELSDIQPEWTSFIVKAIEKDAESGKAESS